MSARRRVVVITEGGSVVATHCPDRPSERGAPTPDIRPGAGQEAHEIEIDVPERFSSPDAIRAFHALVARHLKLERKPTKE